MRAANPLWAPAVALWFGLLVAGPMDVQLHNPRDVEVSNGVALVLCGAAFAIACLVSVGIAALSPERRREPAAAVVVGVAGLLWAEGMVGSALLPPLDGQVLDWSPYRLLGLVEVVVWAAVLAVAVIGRGWLAPRLAWISGALVVVQGAPLVLAFATSKPAKPTSGAGEADLETLATLSSDHNVLQLLLDSFQAGPFFQLVEQEGLEDRFPGFVGFPDTLTTAGVTSASLPALLTGRAPRNEAEVEDFFRGDGEKPYFVTLQDAGYDVGLAMTLELPPTTGVHRASIRADFGKSTFEGAVREGLRLLDLSILVRAPILLKPRVYQGHRGLFGAAARNTVGAWHHKEFLRGFTEALRIEEGPPRYRFLHLLPPHPPYTSRRNCRYAGRVRPPTDAARQDEMRCAVRALVSVLDRLREIGAYDDTLVVVHSDHGHAVPLGADGLPEGLPQSTAGRGNALLLVKPRGATGPLRLSPAHASTLDIPRTVLAAEGLSANVPGLDLLDPAQTGEGRTRRFGDWVVDGSIWDGAAWTHSVAEGPEGPDATPLGVGDRVDFSIRGTGSRYRRDGWGLTESEGTWALGPAALLELPMSVERATATLEGDVHNPPQRVIVSVGELRVFDEIVREKRARIVFPVVATDGAATVRVEVPHAKSPSELGTAKDGRRLGLFVAALSLTASGGGVELAPAPLGPGARVDFTTAAAQPYQRGGWARPEPEGTWALGPAASLVIPLEGTDTVVLRLEGRVFHPPQRVIASVGGRVVEDRVYDKQTFQLDLPVSADGTVSLDLALPDAHSPASLGKSADARVLGVMIRSLEVVGR